MKYLSAHICQTFHFLSIIVLFFGSYDVLGPLYVGYPDAFPQEDAAILVLLHLDEHGEPVYPTADQEELKDAWLWLMHVVDYLTVVASGG